MKAWPAVKSSIRFCPNLSGGADPAWKLSHMHREPQTLIIGGYWEPQHISTRDRLIRAKVSHVAVSCILSCSLEQGITMYDTVWCFPGALTTQCLPTWAVTILVPHPYLPNRLGSRKIGGRDSREVTLGAEWIGAVPIIVQGGRNIEMEWSNFPILRSETSNCLRGDLLQEPHEKCGRQRSRMFPLHARVRPRPCVTDRDSPGVPHASKPCDTTMCILVHIRRSDVFRS